MEKELKNKLEKIVELVDKLMVDPDIDIEYCIPDVAVTSDSCDVSKDPYILTYSMKTILKNRRYL